MWFSTINVFLKDPIHSKEFMSEKSQKSRLYDSIYMKFENKQNQFVMVESNDGSSGTKIEREGTRRNCILQ
jgi:hypothetical protein